MTFRVLETFNKGSLADRNSYARWLRVLGQELSVLGVFCFQLECDDEVFVVRPEVRSQEEKSTGVGALGETVKKSWRALRNKSCQELPDERDFRYTLQDLEALDRKWMAKRTAEPGTPDVHSLGEILRTVGRFVDARGGRLMEISKEPRRILIDYEERNGERKSEEFLGFSLFAQQKELQSSRQVPKDVWDGVDG